MSKVKELEIKNKYTGEIIESIPADTVDLPQTPPTFITQIPAHTADTDTSHYAGAAYERVTVLAPEPPCYGSLRS